MGRDVRAGAEPLTGPGGPQLAQVRFQTENNLRPRPGAAAAAGGAAEPALPECLSRALSKAGVVWAGEEVLRGWGLTGDGGDGRLRAGWPEGVRCLVLRGEADFVDKG